ncbi:MAG TPA: triose-phosphate isomerase [Candidatus Nanopelagicales bacterium]|nr:triose-phosphate isomerase [Candidatus Nanopelagicales bacterium]
MSPEHSTPAFFVGTSWKMNKSIAEAQHYAERVRDALGARPWATHFVIPSFTAISAVARVLAGSKVMVGAQDVSPHVSGAHTGEVSAAQLADAGAVIVEVGHQERRRDHGETDTTVNRKVRRVLEAGLRPLVCVGETKAERDFGVTEHTLSRQVKVALHGIDGGAAASIVWAYEPAWAIGLNGVAAEPEDVVAAHRVITSVAEGCIGSSSAAPVVLYGGSVDVANAGELARLAEVQGLFVGRAALDVEVFLAVSEQARAARTGSGEILTKSSEGSGARG